MSTPISRKEAVQKLLGLARPSGETAVSPMDGVGLTSTRDVAARCNVPEQACSVRDGYAVRSRDVAEASGTTPVRLAVSGCIRAESTSPDPIEAGRAVRVLTGGPVPPGADAVLAEEDVEELDGAILVREPVGEGWYIRPAGGEIPAGTRIAPAGGLVTPQGAAVMTRTRVDSILVRLRPRVRLTALGSELAKPGESLSGTARFPADNLVLLRGLFEAAGALVERTAVVPDDRDRLVETLSRDDLPEIMATTGGTGNSERDFAFEAARESGFTPVFKRIDIRPGRNMFAAVRGNTLLFGLPGPPAAGHACFHAVILPVIRRLLGLPEPEPRMARFTRSINARAGSEWLVQCELTVHGSTLTATPLAGKTLPPMHGLALAHGLAVLQSGQTVTPGDETEILTTLF
ncbi:molybdopterin molybdotransferase MoeA [Pseudodesulfovibrio thermohalotolerans]|uniref:molybdopterin molybdotransferase MoeA n=1 Tax=Pseudodesulfovibrio thermohalotolerans TaxID=2880651 RepID=UPI00244245E4|nr:molybdopterin molybdotransferase MoeA [Pseudodesulfovibrio thermohalotolerans]WFS62448.1 molybdopterin molybdotransferase MoeA [Pseudodesulfovibrio thermohalotolerans]